MKLNENAIDKMIAEVLNERADFPKGYKSSTDLPFMKNSSPITQQMLDVLKGIDTPRDVLNNKDTVKLVDEPESITFDHIRAARGLITKFKKGPYSGNYTAEQTTEAAAAIEALSAIEIAYDQYIQSKQKPESTVSSPEFSSRRGETTSGTAPFPAEQLAIVKRAMGDLTTGSFKGRIEKLSKISRMFYGASTGNKTQINAINERPISDTLNNILLMDIFNYIVKDMDAGAGAYLFEYFIALLYEGRVTGKETTEAGKMGATDFQTADDSRGSVKFYSAPGSIEQAVGGFPGNQSVSYIVGLKREDVSQAGSGEDTTAGKADPARIVAIDIYGFKVRQTSAGVFQSGQTSIKVKDKKLQLGPLIDKNSYVDTIWLCASPTSNFKEMLEQGLGNVEEGIKGAYEMMRDMINAMSVAKAASKQYITSGEINIGNKAWEQMSLAEKKYENLVITLSKEEKYGKMDLTAKKIIQESKLQSLDQLIAETIRDIKESIK